ncbi:helix-turn-helix transcriptional regulator [Candidatus Gottesmanbacteria bacterium]|nr:helix-turn-helix transcriptional regulator [Candidatus Gottesmanbacteria bacterium]
MKRKYLKFETWLKKQLKNPAFKAEYNRQQPEFAVINAIIEARKNKGVTQKALAKKIGTKQSVISRMESGRANPTIGFLKRLAQAFNSRLEIRFISL